MNEDEVYYESKSAYKWFGPTNHFELYTVWQIIEKKFNHFNRNSFIHFVYGSIEIVLSVLSSTINNNIETIVFQLQSNIWNQWPLVPPVEIHIAFMKCR